MKSTIVFCPIILTLSLGALNAVYGGSATWSMNPTSHDWNTAANWTPATVPNGPADVATFASSSINNLRFSAAMTEVAEIVFNSDASGFNITAAPGSTGHSVTFTISGVGAVNNSGVTQNFAIGPSTNGSVGTLNFQNSATAGTNTTYTAYGAASNGSNGSGAQFFQNSTAGSATFIAQGATQGLDVGGGFFIFYDNSAAENANFTINGAQNNGGFGGSVSFRDFATAGNAEFVLNPGTGSDLDSGSMGFSGNATAGDGVFTLNGATFFFTRTEIFFEDAATGGNGFFSNQGGQGPSALGGEILFSGSTFTGLITTAGNATIINEGGKGAGSIGGLTNFSTASTGGQARIVANGGQNGGGPGQIHFFNDGDGGEAQIELYSDGALDISFGFIPAVTIGSLTGDGFVYTGARTLTVGSNSLNTTFSGIIQEQGGILNGSPGSLTKIGTGTLALSGPNTYTGGTTIEAGTLLAQTKNASATGSGPVQVNTGTLGGRGKMSGAVTIGSGTGTGAFLAPGVNGAAGLTTQSSIAFNADGIYSCEVDTNRVKADKITARGVTINSGAVFSFVALDNQTLAQGTVFTVINNRSPNPITGTFSNLSDGSTFTVGTNTFQANYEDGDGNDLTLTVVP